MSLHDRIKEARKKKGITQTDLGDLIGVAKTTIAGYEKNREPTAAQLGEIADVLDVDVTFLLQDEIKHRRDIRATQHEMDHLVKKYRSLDPYGKEAVDGVLDVEYRRCAELIRQQRQQSEAAEETIYYITAWYPNPMSAGTGTMAGDEEPEELLLKKRPPRGTSYVAPIRGNSMEPTFRDGDKLFIHAQEVIRPGQIGVFFMDGKQWVKELGDGVLISHNSDPEYAPRQFTQDIRCQGLVLGVCDESYFE